MSKLIDAMLSELESKEGSISDDETDSLETLVQICSFASSSSPLGSSYVEMSVESASKDTILRLVSSLTVGSVDTSDPQDLSKKIRHFDVSKILYSISPFTSTLDHSVSDAALFLGNPESSPTQTMIDDSIRIRSRELRAIRKSSSKWKSWIHQWTKKLHERHNSSTLLYSPFFAGSSDTKEGKLLCRICERMIPSEEMPRHSEQCMQSSLPVPSIAEPCSSARTTSFSPTSAAPFSPSSAPSPRRRSPLRKRAIQRPRSAFPRKVGSVRASEAVGAPDWCRRAVLPRTDWCERPRCDSGSGGRYASHTDLF